jgi:type VI secretion system protein ImpA
MAVPGQISSREDAIRQLERVCAWIERNEPSHPAPLLIRRAQRLMRKSFFEIIRDLVPDGIETIERIAGVSYDDSTS